MSEKIRIAVVDDHPLLREGVVHVLKGNNAFDVIAEGASADDAIRIAEAELPDIILLDVSMPGGGIEAADAIARCCPIVKSIMLTVSEAEEHVSAALKAGARGYILKGVGGSELVETIQKIHRGEAYVSPTLAARLLSDMRRGAPSDDAQQDAISDLSHREEQILSQVSQGLSNKEVGEALQISEKTVKHYMTNILQKLQVRNRVEAALLMHDRKEKAKV
ncbi:MAG: response regulator [Methyloligellaceae bacterium]